MKKCLSRAKHIYSHLSLSISLTQFLTSSSANMWMKWLREKQPFCNTMSPDSSTHWPARTSNLCRDESQTSLRTWTHRQETHRLVHSGEVQKSDQINSTDGLSSGRHTLMNNIQDGWCGIEGLNAKTDLNTWSESVLQILIVLQILKHLISLQGWISNLSITVTHSEC